MATISGVISTVKSFISSNLSKYLPLSGGKMTGNITYVHSGLSIGTNPTSTQYKAIHWTDKTGDAGNNNRLATVEYYCGNTGTSGLTIGPMQYIANRGNYNGSLLQLSITPDGAKNISWDGKSVVCVSTWRSGDNWYRKYSDGWIEQGGKIARAVTVTVTFHQAYSSVPTILSGCVYNRASTFYAREVYPNTATTTNFTITNTVPAGATTDHIRWYACGY